MIEKDNVFLNLPTDSTQEHFIDLLKTNTTRIERIVSSGQSSPENGWYDQNEVEWVCVLAGYGVLQFEDGHKVRLDVGEHLTIPAHCKHKVIETDPNNQTIWLAVFIE